MKRIQINKDSCMGCKNCAVACKVAHRADTGSSVYDLDLTDPNNESRNAILENAQKNYRPLFCRHCEKPGCVNACMSGAMEKDAKSGLVQYDVNKCAQCFMCVMNCPFGVLKPNRSSNSFVIKCDFCKEHNSEPSCVKMCPTKTIKVSEVM